MAKKQTTMVSKIRSWFSEQRELLSDFKEQLDDLKKEREEQTLAFSRVRKRPERSEVKESRTRVDISIASVVKAAVATAIIAMSLYVAFLLKDIIVLVLVSFFVAAMLNPFVDYLQKYKVPRGIGVLLSYIIILFVIIVSIIALVPVLKTQIDKLFGSIAAYLGHVAEHGFTSLSLPFVSSEMELSIVNWLNSLRDTIDLNVVFDQLRAWFIENQNVIREGLGDVSSNFFGVLSNVASGLGNIVIVLLLTFFIIVEKDELKGFAVGVLPEKHRLYFNEKLRTIQKKIGAWVKGQILLGLAVGAATYIGFLLLWLFGIHIEEMGILSIIAGLTEVIPVIGPLLAGIIAALVAANLGLIPMLVVILMFIIIQQLENNILVPVIMRHAVGLSSFVIIVGMLVGVQFFGFLGLILAVPVTTIIGLFVTDYMETRRKQVDQKRK